jgi:hypothetical protein
MKPENDRRQSEQPGIPEPLAPKRRFRIEKLEQRIAPKKGGKNNGNSSHTMGGSTRITGY